MKKITNEQELNEAVNGHDVCVCKYGANWCGPCRMIEKSIKNIEDANIDSAEFLEVNVDEADEDFITKTGIRNIPVLQFYKNGVLADKTVGVISEQDLINKINELKEE